MNHEKYKRQEQYERHEIIKATLPLQFKRLPKRQQERKSYKSQESNVNNVKNFKEPLKTTTTVATFLTKKIKTTTVTTYKRPMSCENDKPHCQLRTNLQWQKFRKATSSMQTT